MSLHWNLTGGWTVLLPSRLLIFRTMSKLRSRGFEISRDLMVRNFLVMWLTPRDVRENPTALRVRLTHTVNSLRSDAYLSIKSTAKKTSNLGVTGPCEGKPPVTDEFPSQRASNAENISISWRHHVLNNGDASSGRYLWTHFHEIIFDWHRREY